MNINEYLADLEYIVNIDSGKDSPEGISKIADFFLNKFSDIGWNTKKYELEPGSCLVCTNREAEHYDLMLIGHLDTVFSKGTVEKRPFTIKGDRAYGPGVMDMKQGSLLMYYILKELPEDVNEKLNIVAIFNPDEESGSTYSIPVYSEYAKKCDYAYIYEGASGDGARCVQRKGRLFFSVNFNGIAGHCGFVFQNGSRSAISEMAKWIVKLDSLQNKERDTTVNIGVVSGGTTVNTVAENAYMEVDFRIALKEEMQRIESTIKELITQAKENGIEVEISGRSYRAPLVPTEEALKYIERVEKIAKENGINYHYRLRGGVSDGNNIAECGAICLDAMGPAGDDDHSDREYLLLDSIEPSMHLSMALIKDLATEKE